MIMPNIRIPNILTDLAHVGAGGLISTGNPLMQQELDLCRKWGYRIAQEHNRVYLRFDEDQVVPYWIQRETPNLAWEGLRVNGFLTIDSTNREALDQAAKGAPGGTLVCAEEQTAGRGREGRTWYSPAGSGLYFSLVVRPKQPGKFWPLLTHVASVGLVRSLQDLANGRTIPQVPGIDIKWPNDVLLGGRKCAGILLQTQGSGADQAVVVGVGLNIRPQSVPPGMEKEATSLDDAVGAAMHRRRILVNFLKHFQALYDSFERGNHAALIETYKQNSTMHCGTQIWIGEGDRRRSAMTCGIDEMGALVVQTEEGTQETIIAGSVRLQNPR